MWRNITAKASRLWRMLVHPVCEPMTYWLHNIKSFLSWDMILCGYMLFMLKIIMNTEISNYHNIKLCKMAVSGVGWGGQFSDRCLYTTYRCSRNSEWLPWRLTTTHRSRQGNRKNIINKGTNNPRNKRKLNAPLPHVK